MLAFRRRRRALGPTLIRIIPIVRVTLARGAGNVIDHADRRNKISALVGEVPNPATSAAGASLACSAGRAGPAKCNDGELVAFAVRHSIDHEPCQSHQTLVDLKHIAIAVSPTAAAAAAASSAAAAASGGATALVRGVLIADVRGL